MNKFLQCFCLILLISTTAYGQFGEIQGIVTDADSGKPIPFANVVTKVNNSILGAQTDFDGFYRIKSITPGEYDFEVSFIGYLKETKTNVVISRDKTTFLNIELGEGYFFICAAPCCRYLKVPLLKADETSTGATIIKEDIEHSPKQDINSIISGYGGIYQRDQ